MSKTVSESGLDRPHLYALCMTIGPDPGHKWATIEPKTTSKVDFCLQNQRDKYEKEG
jgi:hypothetical protein